MAHRVKGFGEGVDSEIFNSGLYHQADVSKLHQAQVFEAGLTPEHFDAVNGGIPVVNTVFADQISTARGVEVYPHKIISSDRSAHGVGFGRITGYLPRKGRDGTLLEVALKPFSNPEKAANEANGYLWLAGLAIETFEPVAILPALHGSHAIGITKKSSGLMSLDRDEWIIGGRVDDEYKMEVAARNERTVSDISGKMAITHAHGGFLPDGQIKNWAVTPEGEIGAIDTENFMTLALGHEEAPARAWEDINKLVKSLILDTKDQDSKMFGVGMFAGLPLAQLRASVGRLVIHPYVAELEKLFDGADTDEKQKQIYELSEGIQMRFEDDTQWPQHLAEIQHQHRGSRRAVTHS